MPDIDPEKAKEKIESGATLLDVRTGAEYREERIEGSRLIVLDRDFLQAIESQDRSKEYIVYCRTGSRSRIAMRFMENMGFPKTYNLLGGIIRWKSIGYPVTTGE